MESQEVLEALKPKQTLGGEYARYWTRWWAYALDGAVVMAICAVLPNGFWLLLIVNWLYKAGMECSPKQATLGKLCLGLYVTNAGGGRLSFGKASLRHWLKPVFLARAWFYFLIAYGLRMGEIGTKVILEQPFWHDRVAGALVVFGGATGAALPRNTRMVMAGAIVLAQMGASALKAMSIAKQAGTEGGATVSETAAAPARPSPPSVPPGAKEGAAAPAGRGAKPAAQAAVSTSPVSGVAVGSKFAAAASTAAAPGKPGVGPAAGKPVEASKAAKAPPEAPPAPPPPAPPPPPPVEESAPATTAIPYDEIFKACESELGVFCDPESSSKSAKLRCILQNRLGLMAKCRKRIKAWQRESEPAAKAGGEP